MSLSTIMITNQEDGFLRDIWYFAVRADELKLGRLLSLKLLGEPIVLGRQKTGQPFALRDICPHRGIPLSDCLLYTSPSPRDRTRSRMPSSA